MLRGKEPTAKLARKQQVSDALLHKWREQFFEGGKAAMNFENGASVRQGSQQKALERQIEELQKVIGEQAVEIRFF